MNHKLLILGSLEEFVPLTRMAGQRGITTLVCDGYPEGPAKALADQAYDIPVTDIDAIAALCREEQVDGIVTAFSDLLLECMVKIAGKAGLPCYLQPEQLAFYRDKSAMKSMFRRLNIGTPRFITLKKDFTDRELEGLRFPAVVKPVDKYGSRGLLVLDSPEEIRRHFDYVCETSRRKEILAEEYNAGFEFNMMAWVHKGKVFVLSIADREKTPIGKGLIPISTRNVYPSRLMSQVYPEAKETLEKIIAFTGQKEGELSMQFFWDPERGIQVGETAARFLGYEHELIEYSSGFSVEKLLLDSVYDPEAMEKDLLRHDPWFKTCSAVLYFQGREKVIGSQAPARALEDLPFVRKACFFYREGEQVQEFVRPYTARFCISAASREEVDAQTRYIFDHIRILDTEGQEILYRNQIPDYPEF